MTDEPSRTPQSADPPPTPATASSVAFSADPRAMNAFGRFFPGPTTDDPRTAARLDALSHLAERRAAGERQRAERRAARGGPQTSVTGTDEVDRLVEALHEQTDVIRALLDADIAIRDDARSTAQNSRTLAVAGTVIALFTLLAGVVTVVIAFRQ